MADKITSDLSANSAIYDAIRQIAFHKLVNPRNNVIKNTAKISGFVVKIHTDGELSLYSPAFGVLEHGTCLEFVWDTDNQQHGYKVVINGGHCK